MSSRSKESEFYHDMVNQIAIAQGKLKVAQRTLQGDLKPEDQKVLADKLAAAHDATNKMLALMKQRRESSDEAA